MVGWLDGCFVRSPSLWVRAKNFAFFAAGGRSERRGRRIRARAAIGAARAVFDGSPLGHRNYDKNGGKTWRNGQGFGAFWRRARARTQVVVG